MMRITVDRTNLLKSLGRVHRVVERRNTVPILANIVLEADSGQLRLRATDLDLEIAETIAAEILSPGATTLPAYLLYDIIRKLPDGCEVLFEMQDLGDFVAISSGRSRFELPCLPRSEFPELEPGVFDYKFSIGCAALKRLVDCTQFAISTEEMRYYLNGIYFHVVENESVLKLCAVATDGHRLSKAELEAPQEARGMVGVIIPRKTVVELQKLLHDGGDHSVFIEVSAAKIRFTFDSVILISKLIDGNFPDYQRVIPLENDRKLVVKRTAFTVAVDRVSTIVSERGRAIKLSLTNNQLVLTAHNSDSAQAKDQLEVSYDALEMEIGFNSRYLLDITSQLTSEDIVFMLSESGSPALIYDSEETDALYVLMPMRV